MRTAIIGLGIIGAQWARHLHSDGVLVATWNRSTKADAPLVCAAIDELPRKADILHLCLADPGAVSTTLEALQGGLESRHLVIQSSTIDPSSAARFHKLVTECGARYVEAPFTGSLPAAERREVVFYVGAADKGAIADATPYLNRLSKKVIEIGTERQAAAIKLAMNLQIASVMQALAEALTLSRAVGVSDEIFFEAFKLNAAYSGVAALKEPKLRTHDFSPQFSTKHMAKDLRLLRREFPDKTAPFLNALQSVFAEAEGAGFSDEDFSSLIRLLR